MQQTLILDGETLTVEQLYTSAHDPKTIVSVCDDKWEKISECRKLVNHFADTRQAIYGITTSCGGFVNYLLPEDQVANFQVNLIRSVSTNVGPFFDNHLVRSAMIARVNTLCRGYSGISAEHLKIYLDMINKYVYPCIPQLGSLGTSGDLGPLGFVALVCIGEWKAEYNGVVYPGKEAMEKAGIPLMKLGAKEGLSLINGTSMMVALATEAAYTAEQLVKTSDVIAALSLQTLLGRKNPFDLRVHQKKYHPGQFATAQNVSALIEDSQMVLDEYEVSKDLSKVLKQLKGIAQKQNIPVEDAYSLRCTPQYVGPVRDSIDYVKKVLYDEINSSNDNPLIFTEYNTFIHNGHFHGQYISNAMDYLKISIMTLGIISDRRVDRFMTEANSNGLPPFLLKEKQGIRNGIMPGQYMGASLVAENRTLAVPASIQSIPTTGDFQDVVSFGLIAGRQALQVIGNVQYILSFELLCAAQATDLRGTSTNEAKSHGPSMLSPATKCVYDLVRTVVPYLDFDICINPYLEQLTDMIKNGSVLRTAEEKVGKLKLNTIIENANDFKSSMERGKQTMRKYVQQLEVGDAKATLDLFTPVINGSTIANYLGVKSMTAKQFYADLYKDTSKSVCPIRHVFYDPETHYGIVDFDYEWTLAEKPPINIHVNDDFYLDETHSKIKRLDIVYDTVETLPAFADYQNELKKAKTS